MQSKSRTTIRTAGDMMARDTRTIIEAACGISPARASAFATELAGQMREDDAAARRAGQREPIAVRDLLEWAFGREYARLRFDQGIRAPHRAGVGIEWVMMQRGATGARIDGGGVSYPHDDAEIVADCVAALPRRDMALRVAELARACRTPDPMVGVVPRLRPAGWHVNRWGRNPATADARELGREGWQPVPRRNRKGVVVQDVVRYTPVTVYPAPGQIAQARRDWLGWIAALIEVQHMLQTCGLLTRWQVTDALPPTAPWRRGY